MAVNSVSAPKHGPEDQPQRRNIVPVLNHRTSRLPDKRIQNPSKNFVLYANLLLFLFDVIPGAWILGNHKPQPRTDPHVLGPRTRRRERIPWQVLPVLAVVIDPETVAVFPVFFRLVLQDERVRDGGFSQVGLRNDLDTVPVPPVEPEVACPGCVTGCCHNAKRVPEDVLFRLWRVFEIVEL